MAPIFFYCNMEDSDLLSASVVNWGPYHDFSSKSMSRGKLQCEIHK